MKANHNKIPPVISSVKTSTTFIDILGTNYVNYTLSLSLSLPSLLHIGLLISYNVTDIKYFRVIEVCFLTL